MSVKTEYEGLLNQLKRLREESEKQSAILKSKQKELRQLKEHKNQLSERSSELAKRLLQEISGKIIKKEKEIWALGNGAKTHYTKWFANYLKLFYTVLRTKIEEAFKEHPNFSVKFTDNTHFTIELR